MQPTDSISYRTDGDVADLIRGEILAGRGLIALDQSGVQGTCRLYAIAREAAHVAGRMDDLAVVDFDRDGMGGRAEPTAHRMALGGLRPDGSRHVLGGRRRKMTKLGTWRRDVGAFDERPTNPYPEIDVRDVSRRNRILVLRGVETRIQEAGSAAIWVAREDARNRKADMPLVFAAEVDLKPAADMLGWELVQGERGPPERGRGHLSCMGTTDVVARAWDGRVPGAAWVGMQAASTPRPGPGRPDGIVMLADGVRSVLLMVSGDGKEPCTACVDIQADGWCQAAWFLGLPALRGTEGASDPEGAARAVWRAGTRGLVPYAGPDGVRFEERPDELRIPPGRMRDDFVDLVGRLHRPELQSACLLAEEPGKVFARVTGPGTVHAWRRQFALAMPALVDLLLEPRFARLVDEGRETLPDIASWFGVSRPIARRLVGQRWLPCPGVPRTPRESHAYVGRVLTLIGHDALPRDGAGWDAMVECADLSFNLFSSSESHKGDALTHCLRLVTGMPGGWTARRAALAPYSPSEAMSVIDMVHEYQDLLHRFDPRVPGLVRDGRVYDGVGLALMADHGSLASLLDASARWHGDPVLRVSEGRVPDDATWPVPFEEYDLGGGWSATCLGSCAALVDEGTVGPDRHGSYGLEHCVATYAATCKAGHSVIASMRHEGLRIATVELVRTEVGRTPFRLGDTTLWLRQFGGRRNRMPGAEALEALRRLRDALSDGRVPIDGQALVLREEASEDVPVAFVRERLELWRPYLPRSLARKAVEVQVRIALSALEASGLRPGPRGGWA